MGRLDTPRRLTRYYSGLGYLARMWQSGQIEIRMVPKDAPKEEDWRTIEESIEFLSRTVKEIYK